VRSARIDLTVRSAYSTGDQPPPVTSCCQVDTLIRAQVQGVMLTDAIPRTPSGKLLRRVLVERDRQTV
jgi:acyl-CoA synthetase (AMP-forming)/AMP-acid ligase II